MVTDYSSMSDTDLADAERAIRDEVASRARVATARNAAVKAIQDWATVRGVPLLEAWRLLSAIIGQPPVVVAPVLDAPEWVQPMAGQEYSTGDVVAFEGARWRSTRDRNAWSPRAFPQGWERV